MNAGCVSRALLPLTEGPPPRSRRSAFARGAALALATITVATIAFAARADAYLYFGNYGTGSVARFDPNSLSGGTFAFIQNAPDGVAVNSTYIYWTDSLTFKIGRANLDGTNVDHDLITGLIAYDVAANDRFIYWTNKGPTDSIGRARLDGTQVNPTFIPNLTNVQGITLDDKHIYWTNGGTTTTNASIGRANLAGTIVDPTYIPGPAGDGDYTGVAVDSEYVYWTNNRGNGGERGAVSRASLDADTIDLDFIAPARQPYGIAVDATHIYWANSPQDPDGTLRPAIGRANLDGTQADPLWFEYGLGPSFCCATYMAINALPATCAGSDATIAGTRGSDRLRGTKDDDVIAAGRGDDTVVGLQGDDLVCGGAGADLIRGQGGDDTLRGGRGDDTLRGGRGKDELRGGRGADRCRGGGGSDTKHNC
jgi:Ca2+-binding RTX toxin-like protein